MHLESDQRQIPRNSLNASNDRLRIILASKQNRVNLESSDLSVWKYVGGKSTIICNQWVCSTLDKVLLYLN